MSEVIGKLSKPSVFLFSEFVIIVLGVLVALAVDNWNESRKNDEIRAHLIASLLNDLGEDANDYSQFADDSELRAKAAQLILSHAAGEAVNFAAEDLTAGEALYLLGRTSRLETVESTFQQMTARGTGTSIADSELRIEISHYYGLARDRADINETLMPAILRYRAYLEELGVSYVDRDALDIDRVVAEHHILAIIRELGLWASIAERLTADIQAANEKLTARLQSLGKNQASAAL